MTKETDTVWSIFVQRLVNTHPFSEPLCRGTKGASIYSLHLFWFGGYTMQTVQTVELEVNSCKDGNGSSGFAAGSYLCHSLKPPFNFLLCLQLTTPCPFNSFLSHYVKMPSNFLTLFCFNSFSLCLLNPS